MILQALGLIHFQLWRQVHHTIQVNILGFQKRIQLSIDQNWVLIVTYLYVHASCHP